MKTRRYFGPLFLALLLTSCDSLEVTDPNAPNVADVSIQSLVTGVEGSMRTDLFVYLVGSGTLAREVYYMDPADPRWTAELLTGPLDPGGFIVLRPWRARYRAIGNVRALEGRISSDLSGAAQSAAYGFAKTVKAYQLLLNLNYMGDNGIKIEFSTDIATPFVEPAVAYDEIERLLDEGYSDLQSGGSAFPFSLSSGFDGFDTPFDFARFNRGLRARVALYRFDYDTALNALSGSFVDEPGDMNLGVYHVYSAGSGDQLHPLYALPTAPFVKLRAHPMYKDMAIAGDLRYSSKIFDRSDDPSFDPSPSSANGVSTALVATVAENSVSPLPVMRKEELLLIRAEANAGKGNLAEAMRDINAVRAAANLDQVELTAANVVDVILRERMYSLFLEGHRLVDVRRHDRFDSLPVGLANHKIFRQFPRPFDEVPQDN